MKKLALALLVALPLGAALADDTAMEHKDHVVMQADAIKWGPAPPVLPAGSKFAVLAGDPSKEGPFTARAWLPAGYRVPPHFHPTTENVTVLSGTFHIASGDTFDTAKGEGLAAGGFVSLPANMHHYAWAEGDTVIQIHATGPFQLTYLNPADDPRTATAAKP